MPFVSILELFFFQNIERERKILEEASKGEQQQELLKEAVILMSSRLNNERRKLIEEKQSLSLFTQEYEQILHDNVKRLRELLAEAGITFTRSASHIIRVPIGDAALCKSVADRLLDYYGIYLQPINHPTVPIGEECLRIIVTRRHTEKHLFNLAHSLKSVLNEYHKDSLSSLKTFSPAG